MNVDALVKLHYWLQGFYQVAGVIGALLVAFAAMAGLASWIVGNRVQAVRNAEAAPRHLTPEQRTRFLAALEGTPVATVHVSTVLGDAEGYRYSNDLIQALQAAGWQIDGPSQAVFAPTNPIGVIIVVGSDGEVPPEAHRLAAALQSAGINFIGARRPDTPAGRVELRIGNKPPPRVQ